MLRSILRPVWGLLAAGTVAASAPGRATAQSAQSTAQTAMQMPRDMLHVPGSEATISLVTMGVGSQIWELFGHSAIWIHDNVTRRDTVFNWGEFDLHEPHFVAHFLQGLNLYQMGGETMDQLLYTYRYLNRSVVTQELDLTTAEKDSLIHLIRINAQPENLHYRYDYFVDNCATRPRDLLDQVLGGQLHAHTTALSGTSFRWHTLRLMRNDEPVDLGVDIGLGEPSDWEITRWQEMFLPEKLHDYVATLTVRDSTGGEATRPLVRREAVLFRSTRAPEPVSPPAFGPWLLCAGLVIAALFALVGGAATAEGPRRAGTAAGAAVLLGLWTFVAGLLGVILTLLWTVTDHRFAYRNENLLLFNPLWLVACVLVIVSLASGRAWRWTRDLALVLAGLCALALVAHLVMVSRQVNLPLIGLALPPALAIAWVAARGAARAAHVASA